MEQALNHIKKKKTYWHKICYIDSFAFPSHFSSFSLNFLLYEEISWHHHAPIHVANSNTFKHFNEMANFHKSWQ